MDEHIKAAQRRLSTDRMSPAWDTTREEDILERVLAVVDETQSPRPPAAMRRVAIWGAAVSLAAAAGIFLVLGADRAPTPVPAQTAKHDASRAEELSPAPKSELRFSHGTRAFIEPGARVETLEQSGSLITLRQDSGLVSYEVNPEAKQTFRVHAKDVQIEVVGTVFSVAVSDSEVTVEVVQGAVRVKNQERNLLLRHGESVSLSAGAGEAVAPVDKPEEPSLPASPPPKPSLESLLSDADDARRSSDLARAEAVLRRAVAEYPTDPRSTVALFSLGRVERARGKPAAAAATFANVRERAGGSMAEDALAEEAISWRQAGQLERARSAAKLYLERYPEGIHLGRVKAILK